VLVGLATAVTTGIVAFALAPFVDLATVYVAPAGWLAPVVFPVVAPAVNWLILEGGPGGGVLLILIGTLLFWTTLFALAHFLWASSRNGRAV
jgi:hypothetical protein